MKIEEFNFEASDLIRDNSVFEWFRANGPSGKVILQVLRDDAGLSGAERESLLRYFDALMEASPRNSWIPVRKMCLMGHPLVLVYEDKSAKPLAEALSIASEGGAKELIKSAADTLRLLHIKGLVHGFASLDSFVVVGQDVLVHNFGCAPLLEAGHTQTIAECGDLLAPEHRKAAPPTPGCDIYTFAKSLGSWNKELQATEWYRKATSRTPSERFVKTKDLLEKMSKEFAAVKPTPRQFTLTVTANPPTAGSVSGAGKYSEGSEVTVEAKPAADYRFAGWSGSSSSTLGTLNVRMDRDQTLVANFAAVSRPPVSSGLIRRFQVMIDPSPKGGGIILCNGTAASGHRGFTAGTKITLEAKPSPLWRFDGWEGDVTGSASTVVLMVDAEKTVRARFEKIPQAVLSGRAKPSKAGRIEGIGSYPVGAKATLKAKPEAGWVFDRWYGLPSSASPRTPVATLTLVKDLEVTARFYKPGQGWLSLLVLLVGCPWVMLPIMAGATTLLAIWAISPPDPRLWHFWGVAFFAIAVGNLLTRAVFREWLLERLERKRP